MPLFSIVELLATACPNRLILAFRMYVCAGLLVALSASSTPRTPDDSLSTVVAVVDGVIDVGADSGILSSLSSGPGEPLVVVTWQENVSTWHGHREHLGTSAHIPSCWSSHPQMSTSSTHGSNAWAVAMTVAAASSLKRDVSLAMAKGCNSVMAIRGGGGQTSG